MVFLFVDIVREYYRKNIRSMVMAAVMGRNMGSLGGSHSFSYSSSALHQQKKQSISKPTTNRLSNFARSVSFINSSALMEEVIDFIESCLCYLPDDRLSTTCAQVPVIDTADKPNALIAMHHPFIAVL
jgi:hypothetical protein